MAGVPTVGLQSTVFQRLVRSATRTRGMPRMRAAWIPGHIGGMSAAELRALIEGEDALSHRPLLTEVFEGLTAPLSEDERNGQAFERSIPAFVDAADEDSAHELFEQNRWTDGLPIVLPTQSRVEAMLAGTGHARDEVVGRMAPARSREEWAYTVEKVAVNAVMAGARPEYLPVILAIAASGVTARMSSLTSMAALAIVNGPIRVEIGMNAGMGAMGPYNRANATIGRAYGLLSQNLQGGSVPGETYMGTLGNNYSYTAAFPENEEESPWQPLHVKYGFSADHSAVSLFSGGWATISGVGPRQRAWQERLGTALRALDPAFPPLVVMDPTLAKAFAAEGFAGKEDLARCLAENSRVPARDYWENGVVQAVLRPLGQAGQEPYASRLAAAPDELVETFAAEHINIVVLGGSTAAAAKLISGRYGATVSVDTWR